MNPGEVCNICRKENIGFEVGYADSDNVVMVCVKCAEEFLPLMYARYIGEANIINEFGSRTEAFEVMLDRFTAIYWKQAAVEIERYANDPERSGDDEAK